MRWALMGWTGPLKVSVLVGAIVFASTLVYFVDRLGWALGLVLGLAPALIMGLATAAGHLALALLILGTRDGDEEVRLPPLRGPIMPRLSMRDGMEPRSTLETPA
jgi:hypothetical protein